ncbi:MAG: RHS repeat protein [Nitrospirae bacterium]|nr:RHS repeat protein [Nitrospirota bacterium]
MKGKILVLLSCILFTSFTLISSAEAAANISTSYGSDGIMTINASYDAECTTSGPHLIIMSNYLQIFSGDTFGVSITEDLSAQHEGTRRYTAYGVGGHLVTNQNGDTVCVPEQNTAITDAAFQNENIVSYPPLDLVRGITTISADYYFTNFNGSTYSSAFLYLNSTLLKSISPAGQSGTISQAVDFSNKKGFQLIKVAACRQTWCNYVEKLVYVEPEDSCPLSVGKPVNAASGNVYLNETDFTIKGTEPIKFTRYYDSAETIARDFGAGWGHTYATRVIGVTGSFHTYKVINPDGSTVYYIDNDGDKVYNVEFPKGEKSRLIRKSDNTFVREFFDGGKEEFNSSGHLTALVDRNGNRITLTRGANNTLIRITDSSVRVITVTNDTSNTKITSITLPDGKVISYAYLTSGLLGSTTYPDGSQKNYEYVNVTGVGYRLTGIKDENNHYTEKHTYDNKGRAITSSSDGTNEKLIINYASDTQSTVTDSLGRVTTYTIDKTLGQSHPTNISGPGCKECRLMGLLMKERSLTLIMHTGKY